MTKVIKWLGGMTATAMLGVLLFGVAGAFGATEAAAESPPAPPARFAGTVTIDGQPAAAGTVIEARIGSASCGVTTVAGGANYVLDVPALDPGANPNCGVEGGSVSFYVGGQLAQETGTWLNYQINVLNLTVVTATPTSTATTPGGSTVTPTGAPAKTPVAPSTGSGMTADGGVDAVTLFGVVALGIVAFGAAGVVAARRS